MSEVVFRNKQGQTFTPETASIAMLQWYATANNRDISSQQREAAIDALSRRGDEGTEPGGFDDQQSQKSPGSKGNSSTALAKAPDNSMQFVSSDANEINTRLATIADSCNLLTPTSVFGAIPDGYEIQVLVRRVDIARDTIEIEGKNMLSADACMDITKQLGFKWISVERKSPIAERNFWEYQARATVLDIDGTERPLIGTYELDARVGSALAEKNGERLNADGVALGGNKNLMNKRINGARLAETGAMNRCLRSYGFKRSENAADWTKPIVCVRLIARRPVAESMDALYPRTAADPPRLQQPKTIDVEPSNDPTGPDGQAV